MLETKPRMLLYRRTMVWLGLSAFISAYFGYLWGNDTLLAISAGSLLTSAYAVIDYTIKEMTSRLVTLSPRNKQAFLVMVTLGTLSSIMFALTTLSADGVSGPIVYLGWAMSATGLYNASMFVVKIIRARGL